MAEPHLVQVEYYRSHAAGTRPAIVVTPILGGHNEVATLAAAATVVLASRTGLPVSTTHIAVGAVIGVGLARGVGAIDLRVIGGIVVSWLVTLPVGGVLAALTLRTRSLWPAVVLHTSYNAILVLGEEEGFERLGDERLAWLALAGVVLLLPRRAR